MNLIHLMIHSSLKLKTNSTALYSVELAKRCVQRMLSLFQTNLTFWKSSRKLGLHRIVIAMSTKYVLPCAGYDRPGGTISRLVADHLLSVDSSINIGSIGALSSERPGEIKDLRSSHVVCIDGCSVKCASKMVDKYTAKKFEYYLWWWQWCEFVLFVVEE